jgi:putative NADPH-quinone reductase
MKNTVFIAGHPNFDNSVTTKCVTESIQSKPETKAGIIDVRILSRLYSDYKIDVKGEQDALLNAQNIVLQFPFYWYSVPAILKLWIDDVLEYGFAYGKTGDKLKGKHLLLSLSTGGPEEAYQPTGRNNAYVSDFLTPLKQTARLTQTIFIEPIISYGMTNIRGIETDKTVVLEKAKIHAEKLYELLKTL